MVAKNTLEVLSNMLRDIKRCLHIATISVQSIFIIFYLYSIITNVDKWYFLVIYILLFLLSVSIFIVYLTTTKKNKQQNKKITRGLKFGKYAVNGLMIVVNVYELFTFGATVLNIILLLSSAAALFIQLVIEILRIFIERYVNQLKEAFDKDFKVVKDLKKIKDNVTGTLKKPIEQIKNLKRSKKEVLVEGEIQEETKALPKRKSKNKKLEGSNEKALMVKESQDVVIVEDKNSFKNKIKSIFKRD